MKTPEEIKKGLEHCAAVGTDTCLGCPYDDGHIDCAKDKNIDAIAYIEELESRLAQVERENKAMLHDMAKYTMCGACKHFANREQCPQHDECVYGEIGRFEWRGLCDENTKEDDNA